MSATPDSNPWQTAIDNLQDGSMSATPDPNPWRTAIDNELVICHLGTIETYPDPRVALLKIIDWHVQVALDPLVSSEAQALIDEGRAQSGKDLAWQ